MREAISSPITPSDSANQSCKGNQPDEGGNQFAHNALRLGKPVLQGESVSHL